MVITINGATHTIPEQWQSASLLTVLRDYLNLTGTKFGCGKGLCGACTVHINGAAVRSCLFPIRAVGQSSVITIEGLANGNTLHPVQIAWIEESVPQCGYCQAGQMMTAAAFLEDNPDPNTEEITKAMNRNLCRCGTYPRIRRAVKRASGLKKGIQQ